MPLRISILLFLFVFSIFSYGQKTVDEFALMGGGTYYMGDLNPYKHFDSPSYLFGGLYRHSFPNKQVVFRVHLMYGQIQSSNNNLNFKSKLLEIGPVVEINFMPYEIGDVKKYKGTPYLFAGFTYFKMDPKGEINGDWVSLQTLGTEGQGSSQSPDKTYNSSQLSVPLGIGIKINISKRFAINAEYGVRKTFTDYLDDVSGTYVNLNLLEVENGKLAADLSKSYNIDGLQRGNSKNKDWYMFYGAMLSFRLLPKNECRTM